MDYISVVKKIIKVNKKISVAESITGGLIAKMITDVPGSSSILDVSFVTYSNDSKSKILGVPESDIKKYGVVSAEVAKLMAIGLINVTDCDIAVSTTGNAGPTVCDDKPVGRVYIGIAVKETKKIEVIECNIDTNYDLNDEKSLLYNRDKVRIEVAKKVFSKLDELL